MGWLNPFQWRALHSDMLLLHKTNENVCIRMTVEGQIHNGNLLHCAAIFLTLAARYWWNWEAVVKEQLHCIFGLGFFWSWTESLQWKLINLSVWVWNQQPLCELMLCLSCQCSVSQCEDAAWQGGASLAEALQCRAALEEEYGNKSLSTCSFVGHMKWFQSQLCDRHTGFSILRTRWDSSPETPAC